MPWAVITAHAGCPCHSGWQIASIHLGTVSQVKKFWRWVSLHLSMKLDFVCLTVCVFYLWGIPVIYVCLNFLTSVWSATLKTLPDPWQLCLQKKLFYLLFQEMLSGTALLLAFVWRNKHCRFSMFIVFFYSWPTCLLFKKAEKPTYGTTLCWLWIIQKYFYNRRKQVASQAIL